MSGNWIFDRSY